jgi:hypothetical protein
MLANVWHWWLGVLLTVGSVALVLLMAGAYVKQVAAMKYPPKDQIDDVIIE